MGGEELFLNPQPGENEKAFSALEERRGYGSLGEECPAIISESSCRRKRNRHRLIRKGIPHIIREGRSRRLAYPRLPGSSARRERKREKESLIRLSTQSREGGEERLIETKEKGKKRGGASLLRGLRPRQRDEREEMAIPFRGRRKTPAFSPQKKRRRGFDPRRDN